MRANKDSKAAKMLCMRHKATEAITRASLSECLTSQGHCKVWNARICFQYQDCREDESRGVLKLFLLRD